MVSLTLSIPPEIKDEMDKYQDINWSEVARAAIKKKVLFLREMDKLLAKSKLTEKDTIEFSRKIKKEAAKKYLGLK